MNGPRRHLTMTMAFLAIARISTMGEGPMENSIHIRLVTVPAGEFRMGNTDEKPDMVRCFYELPAHKVTITQPFFISAVEVTEEQFRQFRPDFQATKEYAPAAAGVSWYDAVAFCEWLSKKEGKPYRLPTEAEWEYACRRADELGVQNMLSGPVEWCLDWFGEYPDAAQADPVGRESGMARVIRGGTPDTKIEEYQKRPTDYRLVTTRAGIAPAFGPGRGAGKDGQPLKGDESAKQFGHHGIGFRVVQAPMPATKPLPYEPLFAQCGVKQSAENVKHGPPADKPYFRMRQLLPDPPEPNSEKGEKDAILAAALHPSFMTHNHSPALTVCPNGDILQVTYTSFHEYEPDVSLMACRLRFGADEWDMPSPMFDFPCVNDHAPLLWTDGDAIHLFWGNPQLPGAYPFQWMTSRDNGATWSEVKFPSITGPVGPFERQPVNTAFRGPGGTMYVASDAKGASSLLWASKDNGATWRDTGGRTGGRHTTFCLLKDGAILGMGGKRSSVDECYMPHFLSRDGGKTWEAKGKTPFSYLANGQRPCALRLQSGRLFMAADCQPRDKKIHPPEFPERGACAAISDDDGATWRVKMLPGLKQGDEIKRWLGYSVARQAPNGLIHLITSVSEPAAFQFAMNEAWLLENPGAAASNEEIMKPRATRIDGVKQYEEKYPNGKTRVAWSAGVTDTGEYLLDGAETWYYEDGAKQREAAYRLGAKTGKETLWRRDGSVEWEWQYNDDGTRIWTQYWPATSSASIPSTQSIASSAFNRPNGKRKAESHWLGKIADGLALRWDRDGKEISRAQLSKGILSR